MQTEAVTLTASYGEPQASTLRGLWRAHQQYCVYNLLMCGPPGAGKTLMARTVQV